MATLSSLDLDVRLRTDAALKGKEPCGPYSMLELDQGMAMPLQLQATCYRPDLSLEIGDNTAAEDEGAEVPSPSLSLSKSTSVKCKVPIFRKKFFTRCKNKNIQLSSKQ